MTQSVMLSVSETSRGNGSGFKCGRILFPYVKKGTGFVKDKHASAGILRFTQNDSTHCVQNVETICLSILQNDYKATNN